MTLRPGEELVVASTGGNVFTRLIGPRHGPISKPGTDSWLDDIKKTFLAVQRLEPELTRLGQPHPQNPAPVDVTRPGLWCITSGQRPSFWRPSPDLTVDFVLYNTKTSQRFDGAWPSGSETLEWPDAFEVTYETEYRLSSTEGNFDLKFTLRLDDEGGGSLSLAKANTLYDKGCLFQALTTVQAIAERDAAHEPDSKPDGKF